MKIRRVLAPLAVGLALALVASACGEDDDSSEADTSAAELQEARDAAAAAAAEADAAMAALTEAEAAAEAAGADDAEAQAELEAALAAAEEAQAAADEAQATADEAQAAADMAVAEAEAAAAAAMEEAEAAAEAAAAAAEEPEMAEPIVIGFTSDASGQYANSGAMDRRGMMLAIDEFNASGGVLGRPITYVHYDTETTPATGTRVAQRLIEQDGVDFLVGAVSSGVANAISQVAQEHGVIYFNSNSSSPTESSTNCHRTKFVWDGHGGNFAKATVLGAVESFGPNWLLLTNDYVWGHETSARTRALAESLGVTIVDELLVPQGTRDFSSYLLTIQQTAPDVVAAAVGGDDLKALRLQVIEQGLDTAMGWINNQQDWPDVYGTPPFGIFGTTWYYNLDLPGVAEFVSAYQDTYGTARWWCPAMCTTTATWPPARCSRPSRRPGRPTTTRSSRPWRDGAGAPMSACSTTTPGSTPTPTTSSRPSTWARPTRIRPTPTTSTRSWRRSARRIPWTRGMRTGALRGHAGLRALGRPSRQAGAGLQTSLRPRTRLPQRGRIDDAVPDGTIAS